MHKTINDRIKIAEQFKVDFKYPIEIVCDPLSGKQFVYLCISLSKSIINSIGLGYLNHMFEAWPERLFIIENSCVVYEGGFGPFDYKPCEVKEWLNKRFS